MALGTSIYLAEKILDRVYRAQTGTTFPTTVYVGLSSTLPNRDGTNVTEPSGNAYARQSVAFSAAATAADVTSIVNSAQVTFPAASPSGWGASLPYAVYYDASSGGNYLGSFQLASAKTINAGEIAQFPAGSLSIVAK